MLPHFVIEYIQDETFYNIFIVHQDVTFLFHV